MPATPPLTQEVISREALMEKLQAVMDRHAECRGFRIDAIQGFPPGIIIGTNWRIAPPLDAQGERSRSPCWLAMLAEVQALQKQYRLG